MIIMGFLDVPTHRILFFGIQCCVVLRKSTDVLKAHITPFFWVGEQAKQETGMKLHSICLLLGLLLDLAYEGCMLLQNTE
jgi:hypothetical protein